MKFRHALPAVLLTLSSLHASADPQTVVQGFVRFVGTGVAVCEKPTHTICFGTGQAQVFFVDTTHGTYDGPVTTRVVGYKTGNFAGIVEFTVNGAEIGSSFALVLCTVQGPDFSSWFGPGEMKRAVSADGMRIDLAYECTSPFLERV